MLEIEIKNLTAAVMELTAALRSGASVTAAPAAVTSETPAVKAETPAVKKEPVAPKEPKAAKEKMATGEELKPLQAIAQRLVAAVKQAEMRKILEKYSLKGLSSIPADKLPALVKEFTELEGTLGTVAEAPAEKPAEKASAAAETAPTADEVKAFAMANIPKATDDQKAKVAELVKKYKAERVTMVAPDKLAAFFPELKSIFAAAAEESLV
jgi:hypothetical protein